MCGNFSCLDPDWIAVYIPTTDCSCNKIIFFFVNFSSLVFCSRVIEQE